MIKNLFFKRNGFCLYHIFIHIFWIINFRSICICKFLNKKIMLFKIIIYNIVKNVFKKWNVFHLYKMEIRLFKKNFELIQKVEFPFSNKTVWKFIIFIIYNLKILIIICVYVVKIKIWFLFDYKNFENKYLLIFQKKKKTLLW